MEENRTLMVQKNIYGASYHLAPNNKSKKAIHGDENIRGGQIFTTYSLEIFVEYGVFLCQ
jgi:hypothetical protein